MFLKHRRQWQISSYRIALAARSHAPEPFSARGGPDVVLGYRFRLHRLYIYPTGNYHDFIHRRPGWRFADGTSHAKGVNRKMARQLCRPHVGLQGGCHTGGGERQVTPAAPTVSTGNKCPAFSRPGRIYEEQMPCGYFPPHPLYGRDVCRSRPEGQIIGQSRSASTTTASLEALSVLPN